MRKMGKIIAVLPLALLVLAIQPLVLAQQNWNMPVEIPRNATAEQRNAIDAFNNEISLASQSSRRDAQLDHMNKAILCRPNEPDNLRIELEMAVMLSQRWDPKNPQPLQRDKALHIYEHIVNTYNHMDYYSTDPVNSSTCKQFMVPQAAVHLACLYRGLNDDTAKAREALRMAMQCMNRTYQRRKNDWLNASAPPEVRLDDPLGGPRERAKWKSRMLRWQQRKDAARSGEVFSPLEISLAQSAVRQYGYTFGQKQQLPDVVAAMTEVIRDFPGTPMATVATGHIDRAKQLFLKESMTQTQTIWEEQLYDTPVNPNEAKNIFIPEANQALKQTKPFVFDLATNHLIKCDAPVGSEQAHRQFLKLGKGDLAWDGSLVTLRKAKALTVRQQSQHPLQPTLGRWCNRDKLPDKVQLPYIFLVVTNEDLDYLVTIHRIEPHGITISCNKLAPDGLARQLPVDATGK